MSHKLIHETIVSIFVIKRNQALENLLKLKFTTYTQAVSDTFKNTQDKLIGYGCVDVHTTEKKHEVEIN